MMERLWVNDHESLLRLEVTIDCMIVPTRDFKLSEWHVRHDIDCLHCTTSGANRRTVWGEGRVGPDIFFVGEAPGQEEDESGRPFVGQAGQLLRDVFQEIDLCSERCYFANVIKRRPPNNREPLREEIAMCGPYLIEQILIVQPKVIVTLGSTATKFLLDTETKITRLRGVWTSWTHTKLIDLSSVPLLPTFHPSYILRKPEIQIRNQFVSDIKMAVNRSRKTSTLCNGSDF